MTVQVDRARTRAGPARMRAGAHKRGQWNEQQRGAARTRASAARSRAGAHDRGLALTNEDGGTSSSVSGYGNGNGSGYGDSSGSSTGRCCTDERGWASRGPAKTSTGEGKPARMRARGQAETVTTSGGGRQREETRGMATTAQQPPL